MAGQAPAGVAEDPVKLIDYLIERMLAGYEQDDDVTVLVLQMPGAELAGKDPGKKSFGAGRGRDRG